MAKGMMEVKQKWQKEEMSGKAVQEAEEAIFQITTGSLKNRMKLDSRNMVSAE